MNELNLGDVLECVANPGIPHLLTIGKTYKIIKDDIRDLGTRLDNNGFVSVGLLLNSNLFRKIQDGPKIYFNHLLFKEKLNTYYNQLL